MKAPILLTISGLLSNARTITIPPTEHDTTRYSQCAALNTAWVEDFHPVFVLPDELLPTMTDSS